MGRGIDEVAEQVSGLGPLESVAEPGAQQEIEAAGHERQLEYAKAIAVPDFVSEKRIAPGLAVDFGWGKLRRKGSTPLRR